MSVCNDTSELKKWIEKPLPLSIESLNKLCSDFKGHDGDISGVITLSKDTNERKRSIEASLKECNNLFLSLASAYRELVVERETVATLLDKLNPVAFSIGEIKEIVKTTLEESSLVLGASGSLARGSYASVIASKPQVSSRNPVENINISNGTSFEIAKTTSFVIGPQEASISKFKGWEDVKTALFKSVKPSDVGLKPTRVFRASNKSVRVEASEVNLVELSRHGGLKRAGLAVLQEPRLNPRLLVRDISSELAGADVVEEIISNNFSGDENIEMRLIHLFPAKNNKYTSAIIEVDPCTRRRILTQRRLHIKWSSCRVDDYVSILQCFKCAKFNHLAKDCKSDPRCGSCGCNHELRECERKKDGPLSCANCVASKLPDVSHSAFDSLRCPVLRKRIEEKTRRINYGQID